MKRFHLQRHSDPDGVSGTGIVAEGVQFSDGVAVLRWRTSVPTTVFHDGGVASVRQIHCHNDTTVVWHS